MTETDKEATMPIRVFRGKNGDLRLDSAQWLGGLRVSHAQDATLDFLAAVREHLEANEPEALREIEALRTVEDVVGSDVEELFPGV